MLSSRNLTDIEQEVRHCFIQEDAPEYVEALEAGILQVCQSRIAPGEASLDWKALLRAAHTLKGGAGLARLQGLACLTHRLEDLLLAVREQRVVDLAQAQDLLFRGIDEVRRLLVAAAAQSDPTSDLVASLEALLEGTQAPQQDGVGAEAIEMAGGIDPVKLVLDSDFRQLLATTQADLAHQPVAEALAALAESSQMLAEVLNLSWLKHCMGMVQIELATAVTREQAQRVLDYLNDACDRVLQDTPPLPFSWAWSPVRDFVLLDATATHQAVAVVADDDVVVVNAPSPPIIPDTPDLSPQPSPPTEPTLRVPISRLNQLNDRLGEMLISYETLKLEHRRVNQSNQDLRRRSRQFYQVREQLQTLYDQLLLPLSTPGRLNPSRPNSSRPNSSRPNSSRPDSSCPDSSCPDLGRPNPSHPSPNSEFDALEMDQFSDVHSLLQDFQELLTRLEESSDDITLFSKGAEEAMLQLQKQMTGLRLDLHATRMRPFALLAERFRRPLWDLSQRFDKPVELVIAGGETLVDRAMLDQLYDPLMHLVRNAFDHGIESRQERRQMNKPETATLRLSARQTGTQVAIALQDDGRGINLDRVYEKALQAGLIGSKPIDSPRPTDAILLNYLFDSGFSTAAQVGELSGRGVGLDVVKAQVEELRGMVQVTTQPHQGSQFTLLLPLSINILPLLVCQSRRRRGMPALAAIPSIQILDFLPLLLSPHADSVPTELDWRGQMIPLVSLEMLMPLSPAALKLGVGQTGAIAPSSGIAIVVERPGRPLAIAVDQLVCEQEMVLKPFEAWVPLPPYLSGCTILPSGEVVPVLRPEALSPPVLSPSVLSLLDLDSTVTSSSQPTALVVDDSLTVRRWMVRSLEREGYQVVQCRDGQEAWERLAGGLRCSLVVSDVEMPRLDGFQLLSRIRQDAKLARLPVALLTSRQGDRHVGKARQLGATGYYTKPLGNQDLLRQLDALLAGEPAGLLA